MIILCKGSKNKPIGFAFPFFLCIFADITSEMSCLSGYGKTVLDENNIIPVLL